MQQQAQSRKRPAPGTSPLVQQQPTPPQPTYPYQQIPAPTDNTAPDFNSFDFSQHFDTNADQAQQQQPNFSDPIFAPNGDFAAYLQNSTQPPVYGSNNFSGVGGGAGAGSAAPAPASTDLIRRPRGQQLAVPGSGGGQAQEQWNGGGAGGGFAGMNGQGDEEDEQDLDRKVQLAKRDAQGKRKQIPPFVQKLSSFLDSNNTSLIRWSDDGRSFIVLDEDEFARTLIPELFKHNNYASFVRQLNMYGFHKTVNITDGSLRQSEKARKGVKPPSMYSHPYFRQNRPDLLWLIQKPSSKSGGGKRKREGAGGVKEDFYGSDEERGFSPGPAGGGKPVLGELPAPGGGTTGNGGGGGQEMATLPRNELTAVRHELQRLQNQQRFISKMITQLKEQNDAFYRQASAFQALHDRHENSINAILTFLATFYNRSLESHGGAQNLVNLFSGHNHANNHHQPEQDDSRVVEEFNDGASDQHSHSRTPSSAPHPPFPKRPQLLLGAGPVSDLQQRERQQGGGGQAVTQPNSARSSVSPPNDGSNTANYQRNSSAPAPDHSSNLRSSASASSTSRPGPPALQSSTVVKTDAPTPNLLNQVPESDQMMSLINSVNATNPNAAPGTPAFDFGSALEHYQNSSGNSPLSAREREDVLAMIGQSQQQQQQNGAGPGQPSSGAAAGNNALVTPQPPAMPDLEQLRQTQQQLEMLTTLQKRQDEKVQELNRRLQPLSPTGAIPGLGGSGGGDGGGEMENPFDLVGAPGEYDPSAFINFDEGGWGNGSSGGGGGTGGDVSGGEGQGLEFDFGAEGGDDGGEIDWDMFQTSPQMNGETGWGGGGAAGVEGTSGDGEGPGGGGGRVESVSSSATSPSQPAEGDRQGQGLGLGQEQHSPNAKRQRKS